MDSQEDTKLVFYKNKLTEEESSISIYTESQEDFLKIAKMIAGIIAYNSMKYFLIGCVAGIFLGFGISANASEVLVRQELTRQTKDMDKLTALLAIARIESSFRPNAVGKAKEQGLWQFHPKYFKNIPKSIEGQTRLAIKHYDWLLTSGCKKSMIAVCWNLGINGARKIKYPAQFGYNKKFQLYKKEELQYVEYKINAGSKNL